MLDSIHVIQVMKGGCEKSNSIDEAGAKGKKLHHPEHQSILSSPQMRIIHTYDV